MKLLQQSDYRASEFEGRTSEDAVRRARKKLGHDAPVRCWKVRRGGVLGFFTRETFVAGLTPPTGVQSVERDPRSPLVDDDVNTHLGDSANWTSELLKYSEKTSLSDLVEGTNDQVTLGAGDLSPSAFTDMLAEAEATISSVNVPSPPTSANLGSYLSSLSQEEPDDGLRNRILELGIPEDYLPARGGAVLDGLYRSLTKLPHASPIPTGPGSLIVVVGGPEVALDSARALIAASDAEFCDPVLTEPSDAGRLRVLLQQNLKKVTVVVVESLLGSCSQVEIGSWIARLKPDYVLGAVSATVKRSDVSAWARQMGHIDALSVSAISRTSTPGELLGLMPIAMVEGMTATSTRWLLALLDSIEEPE